MMLQLILVTASCLYIAHILSYVLLKKISLRRERWDLNICCGKTDGGGINADIIKHKELPNFRLIKDIYSLPFRKKEFGKVLCSHTMEHVDNPKLFFRELKRVGRDVKIFVPPLWDIAAAFNILEHKRIFLTFRKEHSELPPYLELRVASFLHSIWGQLNNA